MRDATTLTSALPKGPVEITELRIKLHQCLSSTIDACVDSPALGTLVLTHVPPVALAGRPLEVELDAVGHHLGAPTALNSISTHANLEIIIGAGCAPVSARVAVHRSGCGLIARALIHPALWVNVTSITVHSLTIGGLRLPSNRLPATLRVGYNHTPMPEGAVFAAAFDGDATALQSALDAGGSTEEADKVREEKERRIRVFRAPVCSLLSKLSRSSAPMNHICPPTLRRRLAALRSS